VRPVNRLLVGCAAALAFAQMTPASAAGGGAAQPDLVGAITANPAIVQPGATSEWSIVVTNTGSAAAGAFELTIPAYGGRGATGTGWSCFSFAQTRGSAARTVCSSTGLAAGASATVTVPVVASGTAGTYVLTAALDSKNSVTESDETNNNASGFFFVPVNGPFDFVPNHNVITPANLVLPTEQVTFNTDIVNNGLYRGFTTQTITDTLPVGFTYVSYSSFLTAWDPVFGPPPGPVICTPTGDPAIGVVVTCTGVPNSTAAITGGGIVSIVAQAPAAVGLVDYVVSDTVVVDTNNANIESNETNNTSSASVHVTNKLPDLALKMSTNNPVTAGGVINHTITMTNNGTGIAPSAQVRFTTLAGGWIGGGSAAVTCGTLFTTRSGATRGCTAVNLAPGASVTFPLQLQASGVAGTTTSSGNVYVVASREVPPGPDNFATTTATVAVGGAVDLSVVVAASPVASAIGQPVSLNVSVRNSGIGMAPATSVQMMLPTGFVFASGSTDVGSCAAAAQVVTCPIGAIGPGQTSSLAINTSASTVGGTFTFATVIDPANVVVESDETNNAASTSIIVSSNFGDLTSSVSGPTSVALNGKPVFAVAVSNVGNLVVDAPTATIVEAGFDRIDSIVAPVGWTCTTTRMKNSGNSVTCTGGPLAAGGVATISLTGAGAYVRGVTVVSATADPANVVQELSEANNASSFAVNVI
jgi:uncharacterized repeat protein (TIGR01451 family)